MTLPMTVRVKTSQQDQLFQHKAKPNSLAEPSHASSQVPSSSSAHAPVAGWTSIKCSHAFVAGVKETLTFKVGDHKMQVEVAKSKGEG